MFVYEKYWTSRKWKIIFESFTLNILAQKIENLCRIVWMNIQLITLDILYKTKNNSKKKQTFHIFQLFDSNWIIKILNKTL